jgi:peptide/nickel transport system substrate-binding protein
MASMRTLSALLLLISAVEAAPAKRVYAGVYLHDVTKLDQRDGVFDVDLELWAKWLGDFNPELLQLANAGDVKRELIGQESDGDWHSARWRVKGTLRGEFPLQRFPFDAQTLSVGLELPATELVPDLAASGVRNHFSITGWLYHPHFRPHVGKETYHSDLGSLTNEGHSTSVNRVSFEIKLHRPLLMVALKLFLPLVIILMVALLGLFIHPELVEARASIGVTALLSCFAFQFTISGNLPEVAYLTIADGLFLTAYVVTSVALVISTSAYFLHRRGRESASMKVDRVARIVVPLMAIIPAIILMRPPAKAEPLREPLPVMERTASARDRVRIGVVTLPQIPGSPASSGLYWDVVHKEPDGSRHAIYADATATVSSDILRFLGDGGLEVSWRLRPESKWSDGKPLVARDLQFASEVSKDQELADTRIESPHEIVFHYSERIAEALEGPTGYPAHALEAQFKKGGYALVREARMRTPTPTLGPYRTVSFKQDERLETEPNPYFIGKLPSIAHVEVIRYKDSAAAVAAFEKGEVDALTPNTATPEDARALKARRPDSVIIRNSSSFIFLAPDLKTPLLQKREVRRALLLGIDREKLRREIYGADEGRVTDIPIPESLIAPAKYDPETARSLLEKSGAAGMELPIVHGPAAVDVAIAEKIAEDLKKIGVVPKLSSVPRPSDAYRDRSWSGLLEHAARGARDQAARSYWNLPIKDGRYIPGTRHDAYDDEIAALIDRERRALYPERREQLRDRLFAAYAERLPTLPLMFASERMIVDPLLAGWDHGPQARFGEGIERWYFKSKPALAPDRSASTPTAK